VLLERFCPSGVLSDVAGLMLFGENPLAVAYSAQPRSDVVLSGGILSSRVLSVYHYSVRATVVSVVYG